MQKTPRAVGKAHDQETDYGQTLENVDGNYGAAGARGRGCQWLNAGGRENFCEMFQSQEVG